MEDAATTESEFVSRLISLRDIVIEISEGGLDCVLNNEQLLHLKATIEFFEQANFSKERLYITLERAELSVEEFAYLLHIYSTYWKESERDILVVEANNYRLK